MSRSFKLSFSPLVLLLIINIAGGLIVFRDYGMSWDEPLFYNYADSIQRAYSPEVLNPQFDFNQVYGKSPEDHKIYGPAYLLLARPLQQTLLKLTGLDTASTWHLVNFLTFQIGLIIFYFFARRWMSAWPAGAATAFLAWQPVLWGHAFINPKDAPFMVFFLAALALGFQFVDALQDPHAKPAGWLLTAAALALGLASAIRVIGPLAGMIVFFYFLFQKNWPSAGRFFIYAGLSVIIMVLFWPYLWADPLNRLLEVLKHMSNNPTELAVLFDGQIFRANEMPRRYLPQLLAMTLTEPTWILFGAGVVILARKIFSGGKNWQIAGLLAGLSAGMIGYVVYKQPAVYDGFRHFLFILPPIFLTAGFTLEWLWGRLKPVVWSVLVGLILLPGLVGMIQMHPYEYAFYNTVSGGVGGAFRSYETDYWLTCYKEAIEWVRENSPQTELHIQREFDLASYYGEGLQLGDLGNETPDQIKPGDLLLFHTRANLDIRSTLRKLPVVHAVEREGAQFCIIKVQK